MRKRNMLIGLALALGLLGMTARGQIPTMEERILHSGLNPEYCNWRAEALTLTLAADKRPAAADPPFSACFRKDFSLSAPPREAAISLNPVSCPIYRFRVNGRLVIEIPQFPRASRGGYRGLRNLDLTPYLRAGNNVITFEGEARDYMQLVAEGIVLTEDGGMVRLLTDGTWKGGWNLPAGWDNSEHDPSDLPAARGTRISGWGPNWEYNPPYYGPIRVVPVGMTQPIFDEEKPVELAVTLLNAAKSSSGNPLAVTSADKSGISQPRTKNEQPDTVLTCEIFDENSRKVLGTNAVALTPEGKLDLAGKVKVGPLPQGAYRFRLVLKAGTNEVDRRDYEVASVGVIKQRLVEGASYEDGLELKKVWSVDCTAEPDPKTFVARAYDSTRAPVPVQDRDIVSIVTNGPAGRYRALVDTQRAIYLAYRYKHQRLFVPHLAVIEWPDDAPRSFQATVYEGSTMCRVSSSQPTGGFQRGDAVVTHVEEHPLSGKMQKLHVLYWSNEEDAAVNLWNFGGQLAVAGITVYEILNDLPALRIADAGERMIGYHTERGPETMSASYYAGPLGAWFSQGMGELDRPEFYRNWYTTTENFIKRMRFSGQNMYLMGHFMYKSVLYPSKTFIFAQNTYRGGDANRDYLGLILRMFARNNLSLISNIEYNFTPDLYAESPATAEEVRAGAPTLFQVHRDGTVGGSYGMPNFFLPRVQQSVLTVVDELLELYQDYPAWKGINFILSRQVGGPIIGAGWSKAGDPLDQGYEDYTIELFQKETGIAIPVSPKEPDRFQKRYDWLMANARQKWIDWRCAQFTKLYREIRDRMVKARPDLKLYLTSFEPMLIQLPNATPQGLALDGHYDDPDTIHGVIKSFGLDFEALRQEPGMVVSYMYLSPGSTGTRGAQHGGWRAATLSEVWNDQFANDGKGGAYVHCGITHYPGFHFAKGQWIFERQVTRQGFPWPRYINDTFVNVLVRSNPTWIPHTWEDVASSGGRLHEMRLFARAYRSLPNGKYTRLTGNGLDCNVWVETTSAKGAIYGYAANPEWWPLEEVTLTFAAGVKVRDLIKDQPVTLKKGQWTFKLGPYDVQTFMVSQAESFRITAGEAITSASVVLPETAAAAVAAALEKGQSVVARARKKEAELRNLPGWKRVEDMESTIAGIQRLQAAHDMGRAYGQANSWELERAREQVEKEALEAIPFLVLGPFGVPKDTEGAGKELGGSVSVVADYRGMETPYLDEFSGTNVTALKANWAPDLGRTYPVYLEKSSRWQETLKTYFISFFGKCHSEHPLWMAAYAYTEVYSPEARDAAVLVGSDNAIWVWVDDRLVLRYGGQGTPRGGQRPPAPDQNRADLKLQMGWNRILVKAIQRGETRIFFRLTDKDGLAMDDLRFRVPKAS